MTTVPAIAGSISALSANQFVTVGDSTTDKPPAVSYGMGIHIKYPDAKYGFDFVSGATVEWFGVRRNGSDGTGVWRQLWHDGNFNPGSKADKATTIGGYGITDALTTTQVNQALNAKADRATTLGGYGITDALTSTQINQALSSKADKATTLSGYGVTDALTATQVNASLAGKLDKSGGTITGALSVNRTSQGNGAPGILISNPDTGIANAILGLATPSTAVSLLHQSGTNSLTMRNAANNYADVDAGAINSYGSACHTVASFMKPVAGQWTSISGSAVLPAGGTWAYFAPYYNGSGAIVGSTVGIAAGGTTVGGGINTIGFAWRIQ